MRRKPNYARNSRQPGELSAPEAADIIGAHPETIRRWVHAHENGEPSRLEYVRRDSFGRIWVSEREIQNLF